MCLCCVTSKISEVLLDCLCSGPVDYFLLRALLAEGALVLSFFDFGNALPLARILEVEVLLVRFLPIVLPNKRSVLSCAHWRGR